jgi:predicted methyltransferase MtxX (methanogen marker protein 4)
MRESAFWNKVKQFAGMGKPTIAVGLKESDAEIVASLMKSKEYAEIRLVGPESLPAIVGFEVIAVQDPHKTLAELLINGEVDGIVRGTIDDKRTIEAYQDLTEEKDTTCPTGMRGPDLDKPEFFLCPVVNDDGWCREQRLKQARDTADFLRRWEPDAEPSIAIYTAIRADTSHSKIPAIDQTRPDADWIVSELTAGGYQAENVDIDLDKQLQSGKHNIHVPVNGMVGNQIVRALMYCGARIFSCPRVGFSRPYEDCSRNETNYELHVQWLAAYINRRKFEGKS